MNRLLIIHCPVNPRTLNQDRQDDLNISGPGENFHWVLVDGNESATQEGHGSLKDLPFADEALVLLPTADVRLIRTKVPMISGKKLEALLPTLTESFLLDQRTPLRYQLLPPSPGAKGVERTIAITSDSWMNWLEDQLASLPVRILTLIPDCLVLDEPAESGKPREFLITEQSERWAIACREGEDWGAGWIEVSDTRAELAQLYPEAAFRTLDWSWLIPRTQTWMARKLPINLIQKRPAKKKDNRNPDKPVARWSAKMEWMHWRRPLQLAGIAFAVYVAGSAINLGLLAISNWRWQSTIADVARQQLGVSDKNSANAVRALIEQTTRTIHAQGNTIPSDFVPMAAKLQVLLDDYPAGLLQSVDYRSSSGVTFTLRSGISTPDATKLLQRARDLQMALVVANGTNTYRILPFAGLNVEMP